jgi:hypothetical protein
METGHWLVQPSALPGIDALLARFHCICRAKLGASTDRDGKPAIFFDCRGLDCRDLMPTKALADNIQTDDDRAGLGQCLKASCKVRRPAVGAGAIPSSSAIARRILRRCPSRTPRSLRSCPVRRQGARRLPSAARAAILPALCSVDYRHQHIDMVTRGAPSSSRSNDPWPRHLPVWRSY